MFTRQRAHCSVPRCVAVFAPQQAHCSVPRCVRLLGPQRAHCERCRQESFFPARPTSALQHHSRRRAPACLPGLVSYWTLAFSTSLYNTSLAARFLARHFLRIYPFPGRQASACSNVQRPLCSTPPSPALRSGSNNTAAAVPTSPALRTGSNNTAGAAAHHPPTKRR